MENLGTLITLFLLFALVAGIVTIYHEEIRKLELFGRLQTTPLPAVNNSGVGVVRGTPIASATQIAGPIRSSSFTEGRVGFGDGRIVDSTVRSRDTVVPGTVLHTITSGVSDYFARGVVEEAERLHTPSPQAGYIVFLDRTSGVREDRLDREYFALVVSESLPEPVDITGWKVFDKHRRVSYKLPRALRVLGTSGTQNSAPVRVQAGDSVIVSSGKSPVGVSFYVNKCSGYRAQFKSFTPTIKTECPEPLDEFVTNGTVPFTDNECYEVVDRLNTCRTLTQIPATVSRQCRIFLEDVISEEGCVSLHRNDPDFFVSEWRLFLGSRESLWRNESNVLYLLDDENRLVSTLVYD